MSTKEMVAKNNTKMINFYGLDYTYYDHPGKYALVLYSSGCNLKCYGCHNRYLAGWDYKDDSKEIKVCVNKDDYNVKLSKEEIDLAVKNEMLDMVIFCGGEFLIHDIEEIKNTVEYVKSLNPNVLIRVDTNGTFPEKVEELIEWGEIDGFAIDIKGPYWDEKYHPQLTKVLGLPESLVKKHLPNMVKSLEMSKSLEHSIYRTVLYPIVEEESYFTEIKDYVKTNLQKQHIFNNFVDL